MTAAVRNLSTSCRCALSTWTDEARVGALLTAYMPIGGVWSGHELVSEIRPCRSQPISIVARWLVDRRIVNVTWRAETWIPRFQFDRSPCEVGVGGPLLGVQRCIADLCGFLDDLEVAEWFARPNSWLQYRRPSLLVAEDAEAVVQAARADRFVATGW